MFEKVNADKPICSVIARLLILHFADYKKYNKFLSSAISLPKVFLKLCVPKKLTTSLKNICEEIPIVIKL